MWPPGSTKLAVRTPHGRSIGPFSSVTPRVASSAHTASTSVHVDRELDAGAAIAWRHPGRLDELHRRRGLEQVDERVPEVEHDRIVVLEPDGQAEDVPVEPLRVRQVLDEQRDCADRPGPGRDCRTFHEDPSQTVTTTDWWNDRTWRAMCPA